MRRAAFPLLLFLVLASAGCGRDDADGSEASVAATPTREATPAPRHQARQAGAAPFTLAAAGDIACQPGLRRTAVSCRQGDTAALLGRLNPDVVAPLGDIQYDRGTPREYRLGSYARTWGRYRGRSRPAIGNHEYGRTGSTAGYFSYFGARAGPRPRGWYSYELGSWHVVVLNSNCTRVGCRRGSAQESWLRADLARSQAACTLAYWHHPRYSSGLHGNDASVSPLWRALQDAGAEIVLSGHDHSYERFRAQDFAARANPQGIVQFVVGTGGRNNYPIVRRRPNSLVRRAFVFGVLELTLGEGEYRWRFVPVPGFTFRDSGTARCH